MLTAYPEKLEQLIEFYKKLPGVGEKSAERMALATLEIPLEEIELASNVLLVYEHAIANSKNYRYGLISQIVEKIRGE